MKKITTKQKRVLDFINEYILDNGYSPTLEEIAIGLGLKSKSNIYARVKMLKEKDYIDYQEGKNRTIIVHWNDSEQEIDRR